MTNEDVGRLLRVLAAAFPHTRIEPEAQEAWASALGRFDSDVVQHVAVQWVETEERFPSIAAFIDIVQAESRRRAATAALHHLPCNCECGWVTTEHDGVTTVRPCQRCNPEAYERWRSGHYGINHTCGECEDLIRSRGRRRTA